MVPNKKTSIICILNILKEYTDELHFLTYNEIIEKVYEKYGLQLERKAVGNNITLLQELDYDIVKAPGGGVSLYSRDLEKSEVTFLIDAIFSSKSIPASEATHLANKISANLSVFDRNNYDYLYKSSEVSRTSNKQIFLNIELIEEAIKRNKRISFQYLTYNKRGLPIARMSGYEYLVSPYYLINNFGRYYLLCNYRTKYQPIQIFRIDYMLNIRIVEEKEIKPMASLSPELADFSLTKYLNEHIYLFGGETEKVKLLILDPSSIAYIYDWFGENVIIDFDGLNITTTIESNETALLYWLLQYGEYFKVIEPLSFKSKFKDKLEKMLENIDS